MLEGPTKPRINLEEGAGAPAITSPGSRGAVGWLARREDWLRHMQDLQARSYEGAHSRQEREAVFQKAFELVTPVALRVLEGINATYLEKTGEVTVRVPTSEGAGGLTGGWSLTWPLLQAAVSRFTGEPLEPLTLHAIFPLVPTGAMSWTHPHIAMMRTGRPDGIGAAWPFQVTSAEDAERQEIILQVLAEAELHERTYQADLNWRILPFCCKDTSTQSRG